MKNKGKERKRSSEQKITHSVSNAVRLPHSFQSEGVLLHGGNGGGEWKTRADTERIGPPLILSHVLAGGTRLYLDGSLRRRRSMSRSPSTCVWMVSFPSVVTVVLYHGPRRNGGGKRWWQVGGPQAGASVRAETMDEQPPCIQQCYL